MTQTLFSVRELEKSFPVRRSVRDRALRQPQERVVAVDRVSFDLGRGEVLGIVGESGSGKSTLARCLVRLYEPDGGRLEFDGVDVGRAGPAEVRRLRRRVQMVFQDPYSSLNPRMTVGSALLEAGRVHGQVANGGERQFVAELLQTVGLPATTAASRPRQLSGGQRQRVAIARALAVGPEVLIADEAVSGLDVSIQAQILALFKELKRSLDLSMIFISHQLSVVSQMADRLAVMYLGSIVEYGRATDLFRSPQHPYTRALLDADPIPDPTSKRAAAAVTGEVASSLALPSGCRFASRCPYREGVCQEVEPELLAVGSDHRAACHVLPFRRTDQGKPVGGGATC